MADIREQDLALKTTIADTDWIRLVTPTGNHRMTVGQFKDLIGYTQAKSDISQLQSDVASLVDSGSNANGRYVKFSDGTQICWINTTRTDIAINNVYGSLFTGNWIWDFPQSFIERPTVPSPTMRWGNSGSWGTAGQPSNVGVGLFILDPIERPAGTNVVIGAIAIGRWK